MIWGGIALSRCYYHQGNVLDSIIPNGIILSMENKEILLDCALALFTKRGYDAVGVQDVVVAAGLTKPTLYHYFGSKRGLLDVLLLRELGPLMESLSQAVQYRGDLVLTLETIARVYFHAAQDSKNFYRWFLGMNYSPPESESFRAVLPYLHQQQWLLEGVFLQAVQEHGNLKGRHQRYAAGFMGQVNAIIGLFFQGEIILDETCLYQAVHQFMHGILS